MLCASSVVQPPIQRNFACRILHPTRFCSFVRVAPMPVLAINIFPGTFCGEFSALRVFFLQRSALSSTFCSSLNFVRLAGSRKVRSPEASTSSTALIRFTPPQLSRRKAGPLISLIKVIWTSRLSMKTFSFFTPLNPANPKTRLFHAPKLGTLNPEP